MSATILGGRAVATDVLGNISERVRRLHENGVRPCLAFVLIGASGPAQVYAKRLEALAKTVGITVLCQQLPEDMTDLDLEDTVRDLNADQTVDGILVQMPLPDHLIGANLAEIIDPRKDVDGITVANAGRLHLGMPTQTPSTAMAMVQILDHFGIDAFGRHAVVVGRSNVVGHPVSEILLQRDATVTVTHRQTHNLGSYTRQADILMVAAGEPHLIKASMIKAGVAIVDAGINVTAHGIVGDVDFEPCAHVAGAITPVPGGVGPVTNAVLLRAVVESAEHRC